ncbi:type I secretion system permease/ATPase [[Haemophilus] felis]|uniref:Type I secretion system permease/ATPase n=1 Tax=[Haemophilus] felis TaxID=123822 RepID=A0A1T0AYI2_9PAST|nr:type I secretion system permease/ATPase [[Haemophilus] felis]OOS02958.1 type I secretion system permease/ATPase [[Haemophilus] felis]
MESVIDHLALATQILGSPVAKEALTAQTVRDNRQRINFQSLVEVLRTYGFENSISKRPLKDIPSLSVPLVLFLNDEQAAVVTKIEGVGAKRTYYLRQTDGLTKALTEYELEQIYYGFCWFIKQKVAADVRSELPEYHLPKAWFWKVIWRFKPYYFQVVIATFLINFLALVSSLYVMNVYDRVIPNKSYDTLWVLSIGVVLAISFEFVAKLIRSHLTDIAGKKADLIISSALFRRVMSLRLVDKPVSSGSYANNLRDFESVREFMTSASLLVLVDLPFLLLFVFVISMIGGKLAIVPLILIPLVILVGFLVQPRIARYMNESMRESSQRQGLVVEAIEGIETLKANNATNWAQHRWDMYTAKTSASQIKVKDLSGFIVNFSVAMQQLNTVFLVLLGTYLIHSQVEGDRITMGALIACVILSGRALSPLAQIAGLATRFQQARLALQGVNAIVDRPIDRLPDRNYVTLDTVQGQISFNNVHFQYGKEGQPVLSNANLVIRPNEKVAILGRIGSGKTTFLNLASGLYEPTQGNVTLDNVDLRQLDPNYLRNQVTLFSQSPRLFLGSLRENLDMARSDGFSSDQQLLAALQRFGLERIIQGHPRGLDMPLGENGMGLSGGQKQLVALARMTLKDPRVVLLDEPTASLDQASENQVLNALANWCQNRTMIVVTHRPQVLKLVDRIVVIDNGQIVMDGPRDAVLKRLNGEDQTAPEEKQQPN